MKIITLLSVCGILLTVPFAQAHASTQTLDAQSASILKQSLDTLQIVLNQLSFQINAKAVARPSDVSSALGGISGTLTGMRTTLYAFVPAIQTPPIATQPAPAPVAPVAVETSPALPAANNTASASETVDWPKFLWLIPIVVVLAGVGLIRRKKNKTAKVPLPAATTLSQ